MARGSHPGGATSLTQCPVTVSKKATAVPGGAMYHALLLPLLLVAGPDRPAAASADDPPIQIWINNDGRFLRGRPRQGPRADRGRRLPGRAPRRRRRAPARPVPARPHRRQLRPRRQEIRGRGPRRPRRLRRRRPVGPRHGLRRRFPLGVPLRRVRAQRPLGLPGPRAQAAGGGPRARADRAGAPDGAGQLRLRRHELLRRGSGSTRATTPTTGRTTAASTTTISAAGITGAAAAGSR